MSDEASKNASKAAADPANNILVKAVVGVFGAVVAPVLVAMGLKFSDVFVAKVTEPTSAKSDAPKVEAAKDPTPTPAASSTTGGDSGKQVAASSTGGTPATTVQPATSGASSTTQPSTASSGAGTAKNEPVADGSAVRLFNSKNLDGWHTYLGPHGKKSSTAIGLDKDPNSVFSVKNGELRISGEDWGVLITDKTHHDYHVTVEYKIGEKTWFPRLKYARHSGLLLHCSGAEGAFKGWSPRSVSCQIVEGGTGNLACLSVDNAKGRTTITAEVEKRDVKGPDDKLNTIFLYQPGQPRTTITEGNIRRLGNGPDWRDVTGFARKNDIERPQGEWNTLECVCFHGQITVRLNGQVVNVATEVRPNRGKIALQSHGAEIFFRKVELQPLAAKK